MLVPVSLLMSIWPTSPATKSSLPSSCPNQGDFPIAPCLSCTVEDIMGMFTTVNSVTVISSYLSILSLRSESCLSYYKTLWVAVWVSHSRNCDGMAYSLYIAFNVAKKQSLSSFSPVFEDTVRKSSRPHFILRSIIIPRFEYRSKILLARFHVGRAFLISGRGFFQFHTRNVKLR